MLGIEEIIKSIINLSNTYIGEAPLDVDDCQWIKAMSGATFIHFDGDTYDSPNYNIYFRGTSNSETLKRTQDVYAKLKNYVGANYVIIINRLPHFVGRDDKYRTIYTFQIEYQLGGY